MSAYTDLKEYLSQVNPKVVKNTEIITPEDLGQTGVFHIATLNFSALVPNISRRGAWTEDNTLPRVHCAPTLLGCLRGHAGIVELALNNLVGMAKGDEYRGGFYIYHIPFEVALKPNKKMVYDCDYTDEVWLVPYSKETRLYRPDLIGKAVICSAKVESVKGVLTTTLELAIDVPKGMKLAIDKENVLSEGYWLSYFVQTLNQRKSTEIEYVKSKPTTNGEFDNFKQERAAMLSL